MAYFGLYYPYIHFRHDDWLKSTALYWDGMSRIVPQGYRLRDSDTVRAFVEADFLQVLRPEVVQNEVGAAFLELLDYHSEALRTRFAVSEPSGTEWWVSRTVSGRRTDFDPRARSDLAYVFGSKISPALLDRLQALDIVDIGRGSDGCWVGMHPLLARVYMMAVAQALAPSQGAVPIADNAGDHVALSGLSMERLAAVLLESPRMTSSRVVADEETSTIVSLALQYVRPADIHDVSADDILHFRERYVAERSAYQDRVMEVAEISTHSLSEATSEEALRRHLSVEYQKRIEPELKALRKAMKGSRIDTVDSVLNVQVSVPALVSTGATSLGVSLHAPTVIVLGAGAAAMAIWQAITKIRRQRHTTLDRSSIRYLYEIERELKPAALAMEINSVAVGMRDSS